MNRALAFILATVTIDSIGIGLIMPILPELIREVSHESNVASHYGVFLAIFAAMQFLFGPLLGALSDRFGRRPVLLVSLAGAAIDYAIMAFAPTLTILYIGRIISGISGANFAVATAYIADITPEAERAKRYGWMHACFGIGFVLGPALGGILGEYSVRYPFMLAVAMNGINFVFGYFVLPESHAVANRRKVDLIKLNPFSSLIWAWSLRNLRPLLFFFFMMMLIGQTPPSLWVLYSEERFTMSAKMIGLSFAFFGVMHAFSQAVLTGKLTAKFGERRTMIFALLLESVSYVLFGLATDTWMVFALTIPLAVAGIALPILQSLVSKQVGEDQQGLLQGTLASLMSLCSILGPLAVTNAYAATSQTIPGAVWMGAGLLYMSCIALVLRFVRSPSA